MSNGWPSVSVVVVTRDRPGELRECLAAVKAQDYEGDVELMVVYDRSEPDVSLQSEPVGEGVRLLRNERTPGLAGGRNTGVLASSGDLVAFCDDDDLWLPGKLRRQAEVFTQDGGADVVTCGIRVVYGDRVSERVATQPISFTDLLASRQAVLHPSTFSIRRQSLLDGVGLVDESLPGSYAEDYEFLLRAARRGPIRAVPEVLVEVRWHPKSYFAGQWPVISTALRQLLDLYPEFEQVPRGAARVIGQVAFAEAAQGRRIDALRWAARTLRHNPREARGFLAVAVAFGLLRPATVIRYLNSKGLGL